MPQTRLMVPLFVTRLTFLGPAKTKCSLPGCALRSLKQSKVKSPPVRLPSIFGQVFSAPSPLLQEPNLPTCAVNFKQLLKALCLVSIFFKNCAELPTSFHLLATRFQRKTSFKPFSPAFPPNTTTSTLPSPPPSMTI